jgi:ribosomal protein S27E
MGTLLEGKCPKCAHGRIVYEKRSNRMVCNDCGERYSP